MGKITPTALAILQQYVYSAYGSDLGMSANPLTALRYAGQMIDALTGLSFNRARWYDPSTGRFPQLDPAVGDAGNPVTYNKYLYGNGNPVNETDPTGRFGLVDLLISNFAGQTIDKLGQAYRNEKATAAKAKLLVRLAMLEMLLTSWESGALNYFELAFQGLYYAYEIGKFEQRLKDKGVASVKNELSLVAAVPGLVEYIAELPKAGAQLSEKDNQRGMPFLSSLNRGEVHLTTFIPLTGSRRKDNWLSWGSFVGFQILPLLLNMEKGTDWVTGAYNSAKDAVKTNSLGLSLTDHGVGMIDGEDEKAWHHNEIMGLMELVWSANNHGKTAQQHIGGAKFWSILHDEKYD